MLDDEAYTRDDVASMPSTYNSDFFYGELRMCRWKNDGNSIIIIIIKL